MYKLPEKLGTRHTPSEGSGGRTDEDILVESANMVAMLCLRSVLTLRLYRVWFWKGFIWIRMKGFQIYICIGILIFNQGFG